MNPFTQRSRITDPTRFAGRWRELSQIFERLEQRRPVMVSGSPGVGKSSLLTHTAQSASAVLERPDLESLFADLAVLPDANACYKLLVKALGGFGETPAALELALIEAEGPVLICFDNADVAIAAGWGEDLLERLARMARSSAARSGGIALPGTGDIDLLFIVGVGATAPRLGEPFAVVRLGALPPTETRLIIEAYLDGTGVEFSPAELRDLAFLSAGHPAYLQRAAFHLFQSYVQPGYNWQEAYLNEARSMPVIGAPLPPEVFAGQGGSSIEESGYGEFAGEMGRAAPPRNSIEGPGALLAAIVPLILALLAALISGTWWVGVLVAVVGYGVVITVARARPR
jgi:hypothetical protein